MELRRVSFRSIWRLCARLISFGAYAVVFSSLLTLSRYIFFVCYRFYNGYLADANFFPINGKFQAYNPIRRLLEGQLPGLDFVSYTGSGPTMLTLTAMLISGCESFACSVFWGNFLSLLLSCLFFSWFAFLCLTGGKVPLANWFLVFLALVFGLIIVLPLPTEYTQLDRFFAHISQLNSIGNSQLSLRVANATLCSIYIFIIAGCESVRGRAAFTVASFCAGLMWSNDYGVFAAFSIVVTYALMESRVSGVSLATLKRVVAVACASGALYLVAVTALSGGHPLLWISRNVLSVAQDQMWYFLPHKKVLTVSDILSALPSGYKLWASVAAVVCVVVWRPRIPALYACTSLLFITLGAGLVSQIGGHISEHYMLAFERAFWPVMTVWAVCLARLAFTTCMPSWLFGSLFFVLGSIGVGFVASGVDGSRLRLFEAHMFGGVEYWFVPTMLPIYFVFALLLAHYCISSWVSRRWATTVVVLFLLGFIVFERRDDGSNLLTPPSFTYDISLAASQCADRKEVYTPALGGCLLQHRAEGLRRLASVTNDSPDVFSTYSSAFDVMAGAFNSSGSDYIIHALGDEWRARYEGILAQAKHEYITTIREDFTPWESWVRRTNWGSYVGIVSRYHAVAATDYNVLWKRSAAPEQNLPAGTCEVIKYSPTSTALKVTPPADLREPGYVDINVEYEVLRAPLWRPPYTIQTYLTVQDGWVDYEGSYGIPSRPGQHSWRFPVEFAANDLSKSSGPSRVITINAYPAGSAVSVSKCSSHFSVPASRFLPVDKAR